MISPGSTTVAPAHSFEAREVNGVPNRPPRLSLEDQQAFDKDMAIYQKCVREHEREKNLSETGDRLIRIRDNRRRWEELLAKSANQQFPNPAAGHSKLLADTFASTGPGRPATICGGIEFRRKLTLS